MIEYLLHLPYVGYWLPITAALVVSLPLFWLFGSARAVAAAPAASEAATETLVKSSRGAEQRRSFRRGGNSIGLWYKYPEQQEGPVQASVIDRSMGGLCLLSHERFEIGRVLSVRPTQADDIVPWVDLEVCTCRPSDESFEIGCRFVKTPPYSILLLFG
jgi:hypothetical protein